MATSRRAPGNCCIGWCKSSYTKNILLWLSHINTSFRTNIPLNDGHGNVSHGSPLVPYLPPIPPKGTGFHRYVFSLYTHTNLLPSDSTHVGITKEEGWLQQRLFSSAEFVETMKDFRPYTFSFFQSQWDHSVSQTYKHLLSK